jgi:alpha-glucuronidase
VDGAKLRILVGRKAAEHLSPERLDGAALGEEEFIIRSETSKGRQAVVVAGARPQGTNCGLAHLMKMVQAEGKSAYVEGPLEIQSKPSFAVRGIHLNGWPFSYPYAFRAWQEKDWKQFIDII